MSIATTIADPCTADAIVTRMMPGDDVVEVRGAAGGSGGCGHPGTELAAEDEDEQQQEHDRQADQHDGQRRVLDEPSEIAAQHDPRVGHGVGQRGHHAAPEVLLSFSTASAGADPVRAKNTSSRVAVWTWTSATSTSAASRRLSVVRMVDTVSSVAMSSRRDSTIGRAEGE